jgi:hypothetical protein
MNQIRKYFEKSLALDFEKSEEESYKIAQRIECRLQSLSSITETDS